MDQPSRSPAGALIPWQQLEPVPGAAPGTWRSRGVDPQFRLPCPLAPGWVRIRFKMASAARARVEIWADPGECLERVNFRGAVDREFFVNLIRPVAGLRLDPLDTTGEFRLEAFEVRPVSRPYLLGHALWSALKQARPDGKTAAALCSGLGLLLRGRLGRIKQELLRNVSGPSSLAPPSYDEDQAYEAWRQRRGLTAADRSRMRAEVAALPNPPRFSILLRGASRAPGSVEEQLYPHWEVCPADDLNAALARATGDYVAILEAEDELPEHALFQVARAVGARGPDMLYSDEDRLTPDGRHVAPFFKPDWSPEYLLSFPYTGRLAVHRTALVRELGGFRPEFGAAVDYDLALRLLARPARVVHIPDVLYHRRAAAAQDAEAGRRAVADHLKTTGRAGTVDAGPAPAVHRVRLAVTGRPRVSIIIPTAYRQVDPGEAATYLERCLAGIRTKTTYPHYEVVLLDNDEMPARMAESLARWRVVRAPYTRPFNWAAAMNQGAARATGDHLLFLDDDTEVITPDWLECLLEYSQQPAVGAVGARLDFPDGRLQHAGVTVLDGSPGHPFYGHAGSHPGYFFSNLVPRNYSAVTGACLMTRAEVFRAVGGFAETFAVNFNDIDYCLRVGGRGWRVVCTPHARLVHHETATKAKFFLTEFNAFKDRWAREWPCDPFANPNLSTRFNDFRIEPETP